MKFKKDGTVDKRSQKFTKYGMEEPLPQNLRPSRIKWKEENKEKLLQYQKTYRKENKEELRKKKKEYINKIKKEVILEYGGKCQCCGESDERFLTLDHLNGRTGEDFYMNGLKKTGKKSFLLVKKQGFPKDKYQILCFNCNCAKGIYGICPHQTKG